MKRTYYTSIYWALHRLAQSQTSNKWTGCLWGKSRKWCIFNKENTLYCFITGFYSIFPFIILVVEMKNNETFVGFVVCLPLSQGGASQSSINKGESKVLQYFGKCYFFCSYITRSNQYPLCLGSIVVVNALTCCTLCKKFRSEFKNFDDLASSGWPTIVDSDAVFEATETNPMSSTGSVSGEFDILQSSIVCHFYDLVILSSRIVLHVTKSLQNLNWLVGWLAGWCILWHSLLLFF